MSGYRKYDWPALLKEFEKSGLTQAQFCQEHGVSPRYFSQKRTQYLKSEAERFTQVEVESASFDGLVLEVGRCKINCPATMTLKALAALVHTLA